MGSAEGQTRGGAGRTETADGGEATMGRDAEHVGTVMVGGDDTGHPGAVPVDVRTIEGQLRVLGCGYEVQ